jgi:hypothetical protein
MNPNHMQRTVQERRFAPLLPGRCFSSFRMQAMRAFLSTSPPKKLPDWPSVHAFYFLL